MSKIITIILCFGSLFLYGQKEKTTPIGEVTIEELKMQFYEKDSTANALVLYEHGNLYVNPKRKFNFTTDYYFRIKILKKDGFKRATIKIPFYGKEKVHDIKAVTYNISSIGEIKRNHLLESNIYKKQTNEKWQEISFTLSNIKIGSVIEYKYSVTSPYSGIDDWYFQSDIPKIKSNFNAAILGNWKYNARIIGFLKLNRDNPSIKKGCVYIPGIGTGTCLLLDYGMDDIPVFKEEKYMLSKKNFISRISFDLKSYTNVKGEVTNYTKTWKVADKKLRVKFLDNQSHKKSFFKKKVVHDSILSNPSEFTKANHIFRLIKNHYTWNGDYWPTQKVSVKKAFETKKGNIFDINLSLFNALQAAEIESKLVLLATRSRGLPTKLYPVYDDFNYLIVKVVLNGEIYFLDAADKNLPFGLIQFEALNGQGRVMDFTNGSFWEDINQIKSTSKNTRLSLIFNEQKTTGTLLVKSEGYIALNKRNQLLGAKNDDVLNDFETNYPDIEVDEFDIINLSEPNKKLIEKYKINIEHEIIGNKKILINPFFIDKLSENPFKMNKRDYSVDFGYKRKTSYLLTLKIPDGYIVKKLPKNTSFSLPNKGGGFIFNVIQKANNVNLSLRYIINKKAYLSDEYFYLKEFYNQLIKTQDVFIELEKI